MKFVIAMDSFKDCASSLEIGNAVKKGIQEVFFDAQVIVISISDGGEGMVDSLTLGLGGIFQEVCVSDPLGNMIISRYGKLPDGTAIIEMAAASGLELVPKELRNPLKTSTYGTGQLIKHAVEQGAKKIIIGIGGSATNDGGIGMLSALGVKFLDKEGNILQGNGEDLIHIDSINMDNLWLKDIKGQVACDVNNPLYGENGAAYIYGAQKGSTPDIIIELDKGLRHYANKVQECISRDISEFAGSGAAGGLGAGLVGFLNAKLYSGIDVVLDHLNIQQYITDADIIFVGEGQLDSQTGMGKAPAGVARRVKEIKNIPVIALGGGISGDPIAIHDIGIDSFFSIAPGPISLEEALQKENALSFVYQRSREICYLIQSIKK